MTPRRPSSLKLSNVIASLDAGESIEHDLAIVLRERALLYGWAPLSEADLVKVTNGVAKTCGTMAARAIAKILDEADARSRAVAEIAPE